MISAHRVPEPASGRQGAADDCGGTGESLEGGSVRQREVLLDGGEPASGQGPVMDRHSNGRHRSLDSPASVGLGSDLQYRLGSDRQYHSPAGGSSNLDMVSCQEPRGAVRCGDLGLGPLRPDRSRRAEATHRHSIRRLGGGDRPPMGSPHEDPVPLDERPASRRSSMEQTPHPGGRESVGGSAGGRAQRRIRRPPRPQPRPRPPRPNPGDGSEGLLEGRTPPPQPRPPRPPPQRPRPKPRAPQFAERPPRPEPRPGPREPQTRPPRPLPQPSGPKPPSLLLGHSGM